MGTAVSIAVVRSTVRTSADGTGTKDFTVAGFGTPKAALIICSNGNVDGTVHAGAMLSVGATDGTRQWVVHQSAEDAQAATTNRRFMNSDRVLHIENSGSVLSVASFSAWITDGIQLNFTTAGSPLTRFVTVVLFGGADLSAYSGTMSMGTGTAAIDNTSPGFEPDLVLTATNCNALSATLQTTYAVALGAVHNNRAGTVTQRCWLDAELDAQADSVPTGTIRNDYGIGQYVSGALTWGGLFSAFDASGFSVTPSANASSDVMCYLALNFSDLSSWVGSFDAPTATGSAAVTSPGFTPQAVGIFATMHTAENTGTADGKDSALCLSHLTASAQYSNAIAIEDAQATTDTQSVSDDQAVNLDDHTGAAAFDATFTSFDANGWTLNYSAANGTTRKWFGWAVEAPGGAVTGSPWYHNLMQG